MRSRTLVPLAAAVAALAAYALLVEPARITVTRVAVREGRLAEVLAGKRFALLSDLHFGGAAGRAARRAEAKLAELRPDAILLLGDLVRWGDRGPAYEEALGLLARLDAPLGTFAVLGDSDYTFTRKSCEFCHAPGSGEPTRRHRAIFLRNERIRVDVGGRGVVIAGVGIEGRPEITPRVREALAGEDPVILLAHSSAVSSLIDPEREVLLLSGDTHGGQVRLPGWLWRWLRYKPDPAHMYGLFLEGRKTLFVTRGIGTSDLPLRFLEPPEIVLLEFGAPGER